MMRDVCGAKSLRFLSGCVLMILSGLISACGSGGDGNAAIFALWVGPAQTMDAGQTTTVTASIVNDSNPGGATFAVSGGGSLSGTMTSYSGLTKKVSVFYTAPAVATVATVTATSVYTPAQSYSVVITVNGALTITNSTLPSGTTGVAYTAAVSATGGTGTLAFSIASGALPAGLTLNSATGVVSGVATVAATTTFTVAVTDSAPTPATAVQTYNLTINPPVPVVTVAALPAGVAGTAYSQQLSYTGGGVGTAVWAITSGSLPAGSGLTLNSGGLIYGTPTTASVTYSFSVTVTVGTQTSAPVAFTIQVLAPLVITTTTLPNGHVGVAYSQTLAYTGGGTGQPAWAIVAGSLPGSSGLTLNAQTGMISGTPGTAATYNFSVTVTIGVQTSAPQALMLIATSTIVTSGTNATGEVGLPFAFPLTAIGGTPPYTWGLGTGSNPLPAGLSINATTGLISGTPTTNTGSPFGGVIVAATDTRGATGTQTMTFTIDASRGSANNAELNGHYAFLTTGFDASGNPSATVGEFIADGNGNITGGTLDTNGTGLAAEVSATLSASTYAVGSDKLGKLSLLTAAGTTSYVISVNSVIGGVAGGGTIVEFDASGQTKTGSFALQSSSAFTTATIASGYAFGAYGYAANSTSATLKRSAAIGELQFAGTGTLASAEFLMASGTPQVPTSGMFTLAANGRGTLSLALSGGGTLDLIVYVVSPSRMFLLSSDPASGMGTTTRDLLVGQALVQTTKTGSFVTASLSGSSVFHTQNLGVSGTKFFPDAQIGVYTFDGAGTLSGASDESANGVISSKASSGTYTIAANGRVSALLQTAGFGGCTDCTKVPTYFYLAGTDQGFGLDLTSNVNGTYFEPQSGSPFTNTSFLASKSAGSVEPLVPGAVVQSGYLAPSGTGTATGVTDQVGNAILTPDVAFSGNYTTASSGRVALTLANGDSVVVYIVSAARAWLLDLSSPLPVIQELVGQ